VHVLQHGAEVKDIVNMVALAVLEAQAVLERERRGAPEAVPAS
jgi:hypothetical protein